MKATSLLVFVGLLVAGSAYPDSLCLRISKLESRYARGNPVLLTVTNTGSQKVRIYTVVQSWDDEEKEWNTFPFGLETGAQGEVETVHALAAGDIVEYVYDVRKIKLPSTPAGIAVTPTRELTLRFAVICLDSTTDKKVAEVYSEQFIAEDPYGTDRKRPS